MKTLTQHTGISDLTITVKSVGMDYSKQIQASISCVSFKDAINLKHTISVPLARVLVTLLTRNQIGMNPLATMIHELAEVCTMAEANELVGKVYK